LSPNGASRSLVLDVPVDRLTMEQALGRVQQAIESRRPLQIGVVNAAKVVNMRRDQELREAVLGCDLILADGMSVVWASRVLGPPLPERVAGIDLMHGILGLAHRRGHRVYCLGATPAVLDRALAAVRATYPDAPIAGAHHGYFESSAEEEVAERIRQARPDVLLVAMTSPKKERFIARWGRRMDVPVVHGVGGSFDVLAGKVKRAPRVFQRLGLEWLMRMLQEPRRLFTRYLVTNTLFVSLVFRQLLRGPVGLPRQGGGALGGSGSSR
jgi:N-acetylglucosaminyldiphosphoundecaprenol N-acetyl-beta-D-mannosaminyltransferase